MLYSQSGLLLGKSIPQGCRILALLWLRVLMHDITDL